MTRDEINDTMKRITPVNLGQHMKELYAIADELGIKYTKTSCSRCRRDLYNIIREEIGAIASAADESDFNE